MSFIGIDVGTSSCKIGYFGDDSGCLIKTVKVQASVETLRTGELDPLRWWEATKEGLLQLSKQVDLKDVKGIGIIGNTPTLIFVNRSGVPLRPALLWNDTRAEIEAKELLQTISQDQWDATYGLHMPVAAAYPSAKLKWMMKHEPDVIESAYKILQPKDYINYQLTKVFAADAWTSKGILSLDASHRYAPLELLGLTPSLAASCFNPVEPIGTITQEIADETGLSVRTQVVCGWSDTLGAVLALGLQPNEGFVISGSSDSVGIVTDQVVKHTPELLIAPLWDSGLSIVYGPTSNGFVAIEWAAQLLGLEVDEFLKLSYEAKKDTSEMPLFVPYLQGERSPIWNSQVRGGLHGLGIQTTRSDVALAVLEGVALSDKDVLSAAESVIGRKASHVVLTGGGTRIERWNQIRKEVLGRDTSVTNVDPTIGAAMLAYLGTSPGASLQNVHKAFPRSQTTVDGHPVKGFAQQRYMQFQKGKKAALEYLT